VFFNLVGAMWGVYKFPPFVYNCAKIGFCNHRLKLFSLIVNALILNYLALHLFFKN
jgi:hypothetical protein